MLNLEESFGGLVRQLRLALGLDAKDLARDLQSFSGQSFDRNTIGGIERGSTKAPRRDTVKALCQYFYARHGDAQRAQSKLASSEDVVYFCLRGGYRVVNIRFHDGRVTFNLVRSEIGFTDVAKTVLQHLGATFPDPDSAFVRGVERLSDFLALLAPRVPRALSRLERKADRLLSARVWNEREGADLVAELTRAYYDSRGNYDRSFRIAHLVAKTETRRARYEEALEWCERAYRLGEVLAVAGLPLVREPLAVLYEAAAAAYLNLGRPQDWEEARMLFARAIDERRKLQEELNLKIAISERRDADALLQLARYWTFRRQLAKAEEEYDKVLASPAGREDPWLRAQALKELAETYAFGGRRRVRAMRTTFEMALRAYRRVPAKALLDDPWLEIELHLNIGFCQRRLGRGASEVRELRTALQLAHEQRDARRVGYACLQLARSSRVQLQRRRPTEAASLAVIAEQIMRKTGAREDASRANKLAEELLADLPPETRSAVEDELQKTPFRIYIA